MIDHLRILPWQLPPPDDTVESPAFHTALREIFHFSEVARTSAELQLGRDQKLPRMRALLNALGTPQASFATILVAGTKGKGSTTAMLTSILEAAGYRVGRYAQPHLYSYRERVWADQRFISETELAEEWEAMRPAVALVDHQRSTLGPLTTFDVGTALALSHFQVTGVEVAVVEVGVGGAHDATNALEPILSIVGPVGMDHVATLGPTLWHIGREKAGVARRGIDVIVAPQEDEALRAIRETVDQVGARLQLVSHSAIHASADPQRFTVVGPQGTLEDVYTSLVGGFQRENAAVAVTAAQCLHALGWRLTDDVIRDGLAHVQWPGRFQFVVDQPTTIVDGAHNPPAGRALAATLEELFGNRPITFVIGMTRDKDVQATLSALAPHAHRAIVTRSRHPRSMPAEELARALSEIGIDPDVVDQPPDAVRRAWSTLPQNGVVVVTGSLFLVGDVMEWLWMQTDSASSANGQTYVTAAYPPGTNR